jgi:hypothetical protein
MRSEAGLTNKLVSPLILCKRQTIKPEETIVTEIDRVLQQHNRVLEYECAGRIPNLGFVVIRLSATGKDPSSGSIPEILQAIESSADGWIQADLRDCILSYLGPQLMSPRPDRLPDFWDPVSDPLEVVENVLLRGHNFVYKLKMSNMRENAVGEDCIKAVQEMMFKLIKQCKK